MHQRNESQPRHAPWEEPGRSRRTPKGRLRSTLPKTDSRCPPPPSSRLAPSAATRDRRHRDVGRRLECHLSLRDRRWHGILHPHRPRGVHGLRRRHLGTTFTDRAELRRRLRGRTPRGPRRHGFDRHRPRRRQAAGLRPAAPPARTGHRGHRRLGRRVECRRVVRDPGRDRDLHPDLLRGGHGLHRRHLNHRVLGPGRPVAELRRRVRERGPGRPRDVCVGRRHARRRQGLRVDSAPPRRSLPEHHGTDRPAERPAAQRQGSTTPTSASGPEGGTRGHDGGGSHPQRGSVVNGTVTTKGGASLVVSPAGALAAMTTATRRPPRPGPGPRRPRVPSRIPDPRRVRPAGRRRTEAPEQARRGARAPQASSRVRSPAGSAGSAAGATSRTRPRGSVSRRPCRRPGHGVRAHRWSRRRRRRHR